MPDINYGQGPVNVIPQTNPGLGNGFQLPTATPAGTGLPFDYSNPGNPTPTGGANPLVQRYGGTPTTPTESPLDKARREYYEGLNRTAPNEAGIKEQYRKDAQAALDAINARFDSEIARATQQGQVRSDQTRGINVRSGLAGSDFASANADKVSSANKQELDAINADRQLSLTSVYDKVDQRAQAEITAKRAEASGNAKAYVDYLASAQTAAREDIKTIASAGGIKFDRFKTDSIYEKLKEESGFSDLELEGYFNANLKKEEQVKYTYDTRKDGTIVRYGDDGKVKIFDDVKLPPEVDAQFINTDNGTVLFVDKNNPTNADGTPKYQTLGNYGKPKAGTGAVGADGTTIPGVGPATAQTTGSISNDVQAVLEGRNTLYNIRQTMGRTNKAAAYMQQMRDQITKVDPQFDFVASDAGGKAVSSAYYQRSIAAIDSVLPNIDKIVDLSNQVSRVGVKGVDQFLQKGQTQIGNKKVSNFKEAQKLISDEIGLALGAGTVSDMKLQLGFDVTDPSVSQEVFASNMQIVKEFVENRKKGLTGLRYQSGTTTGGGPTSELQSDVRMAASRNDYGTREQLIDKLISHYPELTGDQIASMVYQGIPDKR